MESIEKKTFSNVQKAGIIAGALIAASIASYFIYKACKTTVSQP